MPKDHSWLSLSLVQLPPPPPPKANCTCESPSHSWSLTVFFFTNFFPHRLKINTITSQPGRLRDGAWRQHHPHAPVPVPCHGPAPGVHQEADEEAAPGAGRAARLGLDHAPRVAGGGPRGQQGGHVGVGAIWNVRIHWPQGCQVPVTEKCQTLF